MSEISKKEKLYIPGDEYFKSKFWICDASVDIKASPEKIWPWLVQMGTGRAGWYSHDLIDNLGRKSLMQIDPNLQKISIGQKIVGATIEDYKENEFITYLFGQKANMTYFLQNKKSYTQLTTRIRIEKIPSLILDLTLRPGHWLMQSKQFDEIKKRVESDLG